MIIKVHHNLVIQFSALLWETCLQSSPFPLIQTNKDLRLALTNCYEIKVQTAFEMESLKDRFADNPYSSVYQI